MFGFVLFDKVESSFIIKCTLERFIIKYSSCVAYFFCRNSFVLYPTNSILVTVIVRGGATTFWDGVVEVTESGKAPSGDWTVWSDDIRDGGGESEGSGKEMVMKISLDDSKFKFVKVIGWRLFLNFDRQ